MAEIVNNYKGARMLEKAKDLDIFWAYKNNQCLPKNRQLVLLDNVQFIYELALAELELQAFGTHFEVTTQKSFKEFMP